MSRSSQIAFITVLFDSEPYLPRFFACLGAQTDRDFLVLVVDNASSDGSLARARALASAHGVPCEFIANDANLGYCIGNNQGIERARALGIEHLALINNDIACGPDLVAAIRTRAIGAGHRAWTCLSYRGDTDARWYGGGTLSYWRARGIHWDAATSARVVEPVAVGFAPACLLVLHASVLDRIGTLDPRYFVYYDDTDFCRRLRDAGIPLTYDPAVSFRHYVGGSSGGELSPFFLRISTRNKFLYIRKHYRGPARWAVTAISLASKLLQLLDARRRHPTWRGLVDAFGQPRRTGGDLA